MLDKNSRYYFVIVFFVRFILLYLVWFFLYDLYLHPRGYIDKYLIISQSYISGIILDALSYKTYVSFVAGKFGIITFDSGGSLKISHYCDGIVLFALYTGFIVSFPSNKWKLKLGYISIGITLIYFANIIRIVVLGILLVKAPQYLEFNHKYVFTSLIYIMIFAMWKSWIDHAMHNRIKSDIASRV